MIHYRHEESDELSQMARRKSSPIEDIFEITASMPWWVGTMLAPLAYAVLHHYAIAAVPTTAVPGQIGHMITGQLIKSMSSIGQYLLPSVFLLAALTAFFKREHRQNLASNSGGSVNMIRSLSWRDFELLVGEAFRMKGYSVVETAGGGADGGIDLMLKKDGEVFLVQCKQWRAFKVSVNIVRELFGVMAAQGATGGFVATSGVFTNEARAFAKGEYRIDRRS
ncbi:restriction endonuclease [Methylomicrobium sp. Wu6]|uniref:restriction endonuclease n=1 Tax=Methylomicrobium sp. Wu6 TaxID=3107928 RepID=UPI002DD65444|nr:restriction endonuclease [Methylomicrobium sp. Wu6]MEC4749318.1 restriction endonuclease [Methylomicrobium sp. Wu6]